MAAQGIRQRPILSNATATAASATTITATVTNDWGIRASGLNPDNNLVEVIEGIDHPFFLASQFHPEFKSRPEPAAPDVRGLCKAVWPIAEVDGSALPLAVWIHLSAFYSSKMTIR